MESQIKKSDTSTILKIGLSLLTIMVVSIVTFAIASKLNTQKSVSMSAPESTPLACEAECPGKDNILRSCTPPEPDGSTSDSYCIKKEILKCGGKDFCCPGSGGKWTTNLTKCCVDTTWTPDPALTCTGQKVAQTSNCGTKREVDGTKSDATCAACTDTTWTPETNTVCSGASFTQTSNCGKTRTSTGVKTDTVWTPETSTVCSTDNLVQTGDCGGTKTVKGSKNCCVDSSWTPAPSKYCSDETFTQTSNCGNTKEVDGTKTCTPNLSILKKTYKDDSSNTPGVYKTDQQISKISRDQMMVYTLDIRNSGNGAAKDVKITDTLTGQNQNLLSFVDSENKCNFDFPSKRLTCILDKIMAGASEKLKFRVKVAQSSLNGKVIRNTAKVAYGSKSKESSVDVLVSSIVACNEFCNNDSECISGLACDVLSNKCRRPKCTKETSCNCTVPTATATTKPTTTVTSVVFPSSSNLTPTTSDLTIVEVVEPTVEELTNLPETGIMDLPQTAFFGGGIVLAILGLFLAL